MDGNSNETPAPGLYPGTSLRVPRPGDSSRPASTGGAKMVFRATMTMTAANISGVSRFAERPTPATTSATSHRGAIPKPILAAPRRLKPVSSAGNPQPRSFDSSATTA